MDGQEYVFSHTDVRELIVFPCEGCEFPEQWPASDEEFNESLMQSVRSSAPWVQVVQ